MPEQISGKAISAGEYRARFEGSYLLASVRVLCDLLAFEQEKTLLPRHSLRTYRDLYASLHGP